MLNTLYIKNFALIDELSAEFESGLNIVTGETGAGKSIMVDAFMVALGDRASASMVRRDTQKAVIEATFNISDNPDIGIFLQNNDIQVEGNELILRREISASGGTRCFISDSPVPVSVLKELGNLLVDFHGQHEHQQLLDSKYHIQILDSVCDFGDKMQAYSDEYSKQRHLISEYKDTLQNANDSGIRLDNYTFELGEINKINPKENEYDEIEAKLKLAENSEQIYSLCSQITEDLEGNDESAINLLERSVQSIYRLNAMDNVFEDYINECKSAAISLREVVSFALSYRDKYRFNPNEIENLRQRSLVLHRLRKKYGTYEAVFERKEFLKVELDKIKNADFRVEQLKAALEKSQRDLGVIASELTAERKRSAVVFNEKIGSILKYLGMENAVFDVRISCDVTENLNSPSAIIGGKCISAHHSGVDKVEFFISANKGEIPKPLKDTASGGEISRVMLSIKSIVAEHRAMPMLVFDEIDSGISGKVARKTGLVMKDLAAHHQILAITHLPQIAALGDNNLFVSKRDDDERTTTTVAKLDTEAKIKSIAQMISGEDISDAALESARTLIDSDTH